MVKLAEPKFKVGDTVVVVDTPYEACPFDWTEDMDELCGEETTITRVDWYDSHKAYGYHISGDDGNFVWCENCFMKDEPDLTASDTDISVLLGG